MGDETTASCCRCYCYGRVVIAGIEVLGHQDFFLQFGEVNETGEQCL